MARIRRRGHRPVLCTASARSGLYQIDPTEDHRRRHRLALPKRAKTRAEGIGGPGPSAEGIVMVPRRVFQRLLPERPTPEKCVEAYYLQRTRFESVAERK